MIELYAMGSPNVVKIFIALEEMALPYRVHPVDVFANEQFSDAFRAVNPTAKVPAIIDADGPDAGEPYTVFESGAILIYLAEKTGQFLPEQGVGRFEALQWLMVQLTTQGPMSGQVVHFTRFAPEGNDYARERYWSQVHTLYRNLNARLGTHRYLAGDTYTIADMATYPWCHHEVFLNTVRRRYPNVGRWSAEISQRPAVIRGMEAAADVRARVSTYQDATEDQLDRFLARGKYTIA